MNCSLKKEEDIYNEKEAVSQKDNDLDLCKLWHIHTRLFHFGQYGNR